MNFDEAMMNIIRQSLIQSYQDCIAVPEGDDNEQLMAALSRVIEYYSTKDQYQIWCEEVDSYFNDNQKEEDWWTNQSCSIEYTHKKSDDKEIWNRLAENDKPNMVTDRIFIATATSPSNMWGETVVIKASSVAQAQTKFFDWLKTQAVYQRMWNLNLSIEESEKEPFILI